MDKLALIVEHNEHVHYHNKIRRLQLRSTCVPNYKQFIRSETKPRDRDRSYE